VQTCVVANNIAGDSIERARTLLPVAHCRGELDDLTAELSSLAEQHVGAESLILCVDHMQRLLEDRLRCGRLDGGEQTDTLDSSKEKVSMVLPAESRTLCHVVIWCDLNAVYNCISAWY
jgi:hypothetical protein